MAFVEQKPKSDTITVMDSPPSTVFGVPPSGGVRTVGFVAQAGRSLSALRNFIFGGAALGGIVSPPAVPPPDQSQIGVDLRPILLIGGAVLAWWLWRKR